MLGPRADKAPAVSAEEAGYRPGGGGGFVPFWRERMAARWRRASEATQHAGRKEYREIEAPGEVHERLEGEPGLKRIGLSAITPALQVATNVGQLPGVGKGATALLQSAMMVLATPAELTEAALGEALGGRFYRKQYGVDTPDEERAFQVANTLLWSGPDRQRAIYDAALAKMHAGTWAPEDLEKLQSEHAVWWKEMLGQIAMDPLNLIGGGGKAVAQARRVDEARALWAVADLRPTDNIVRELGELSTRRGQLRVAETLKERALAVANPRLASSFRSRIAEDASQAVAQAMGVSQKRIYGNLVREGLTPGTDDFAEAFATRFADNLTAVTNQWARLASPDPEEVAEAAAILERHGFGTMPSSLAGRRTALVLRKVMERPDGTLGELGDMLKLASDEGLSAEHVVEAWTKKAARVLEELVPEGAVERHALVKGPRRVVEFRKPVDEIFARLYMGMNPGYAWRNIGSNSAMAVVQGLSPFRAGTRFAQMSEELGFPVLAAARGIGPAQVETMRPGLTTFSLWLGQKGEQYSSNAVVAQARRDAIGRLWKRASDDLKLSGLDPETSRWLDARVRALGHQGPDHIDELERQLVQRLGGTGGPPAAPPTVPGPAPGPPVPWSPWKTPSKETIESLEQTGDEILETALQALDEAATPEEAVETLRELQRAYGRHVNRVIDNTPGLGPTVGSPAGEALGLAARSGEFGPGDLAELGKNLGAMQDSIVNSRARAFAAAMDAQDPGRWSYYLDDVETQYAETLQQLRAEQTARYAQLEAGELTAEEYAQEVFSSYASARSWLDRQYAKVIGESGGMWRAPEELVVAPLVRRELALEAGRQGVPPMVYKTGEPYDIDAMERYFSLYNAPPPDVVPNRAYRQLLDKAASAVGIKKRKLAQYSDDEMLQLLNHIRGREGRSPITVDELWQARDKAREAGLERGRALPERMQLPGAVPEGAVPPVRPAQMEEFRGLAKRLEAAVDELDPLMRERAQGEIDNAVRVLASPDATEEELLDVLLLTTRTEGINRRAAGDVPDAFLAYVWSNPETGKQLWGTIDEVLDLKNPDIQNNFRSVTFAQPEPGTVMASRATMHSGGDGTIVAVLESDGTLVMSRGAPGIPPAEQSLSGWAVGRSATLHVGSRLEAPNLHVCVELCQKKPPLPCLPLLHRPRQLS
jgi:hypothetical protein